MVTSNCKDPFSPRIGILTFEIASAMSSLASLHHMLSDPTIRILRSDIMRSQGVAYLNSTDQSILIKQCCAELITELDRAAEFVARLSHRCQSPFSTGFGRIYTDLKSGSIDPTRLGLKLTAKSLDRRFKKLDEHVRTASRLLDETETLSELEAMEMKRFGRFSGPFLKEMKHISTVHLDVKSQAQKVNKLKNESLWNQTYDRVTGLMALACCSLFVRICAVFGPFVPGLPHMIMDKEHSGPSFSRLRMRIHPRSGPLERRSGCKETPLWKSCPIPSAEELDTATSWRGMLEAEAGTVGGSGLALRYANIIMLAENMMVDERLEEGEREELYGLIPGDLNRRVEGKLRKWRRERGGPDRRLAGGWKEGVRRILGWLGPVAHDTLRWEMERSMDRKLRFEGRGRTYLMQTLHFADKVKTEAAIVEVLVGLSMVCWYSDWNLVK